MTRDAITESYRKYIACLNVQDCNTLDHHVADGIEYNGTTIGLDGYRDMLVRDQRVIPVLSFNIAILACDPPIIAG